MVSFPQEYLNDADDIVEDDLDEDVNVLEMTNHRGETALHVAAASVSSTDDDFDFSNEGSPLESCVEILLDELAHLINAKNQDDQTPLHLACNHGKCAL